MTQGVTTKAIRPRKSLGHTVWFKILLAALFFTPAVVQIGYDPARTTELIATVLANPLTLSVPVLLPLAKGLLLVVAILPFVLRRDMSRVVLGYYVVVLLVVGVFQNMAFTEENGFVWLIGNTLVQFIVVGWCLADIIRRRSTISFEMMNRGRLWVLLPMAVAFLFPYNFESIQSTQVVHPDFGPAILYNDAGLTYCMITPVILGILIIFSRGVNSGLLSVASFVAVVFGLLNMATWFVFQPENWWMGVLHLPLLVLAVYGLILARGEPTRRSPTSFPAMQPPNAGT